MSDVITDFLNVAALYGVLHRGPEGKSKME